MSSEVKGGKHDATKGKEEAPRVAPTQSLTPAVAAQNPVDKSKLMKFRLLPGVAKHEGADYSKEPTALPDGREVYPNKVYEAGDVVFSSTDLTKTMVNKFERLHADDQPMRKTSTPHAQAQEMTRELEKLSDKRLREIAEDEEIDVAKAKTREEIIEIIRNHLNP